MWGGEPRDSWTPDGGRIRACILAFVVGEGLRDSWAPDGGYMGACAGRGTLRNNWVPDSGYTYNILGHVLTCVLAGGYSRIIGLQMAEILGHEH